MKRYIVSRGCAIFLENPEAPNGPGVKKDEGEIVTLSARAAKHFSARRSIEPYFSDEEIEADEALIAAEEAATVPEAEPADDVRPKKRRRA
jgi:hypothetical protein